ncbi:MAG: GatB/YqeY domain-containing protein [Candidatus Zixiibacteriota bacterium]
MNLAEQIDSQIIQALKNGDKKRLLVLRGLKSDLKYRSIDKGQPLADKEVIQVLSSAAKKRRDSIEQFEAGGRDDLVNKEQGELEIIQTFLPEQLSEDALRKVIAEAIAEAGISSPQQLGMVMKVVMPKVAGLADGKQVSKLAAEILAK